MTFVGPVRGMTARSRTPPPCGSGRAGCSATAPAAARAGRWPRSCSTSGCAGAAGRCGSPSPTSSSKTPAATGPRSEGARPTSSRWRRCARGRTCLSTKASSSPPMRRCAAPPARAGVQGLNRSWPGSRAGWMKPLAMPSRAWSSSTRPMRWPTPPEAWAAAGAPPPPSRGRAGLKLQSALPDARVLYVSATGATTLPGLAYAGRLGLWAAGETPFETREAFVSAMEAGGVAAMEVVARDLKALGLYQARALSYRGVEVDILEHALTLEQRRIYDAYAGAFQVIHAHLDAALEATGVTDGKETLNPQRQVRRTLGLRGRQAALLRPPARRHEVPHPPPGGGGRPRRGPRLRRPARLDRRGAAGAPAGRYSPPRSGTT